MKLRHLLSIILVLACSLGTMAQKKDAKKIKLVKKQVDKNVSVKLPENFVVMSDDDIAKKYPAYRKPVATFTNEDRMIDFGFNVANNRWGSNLGLLHSFYRSTILQVYDKVEWIQDTIVTAKNRNFIAFEFVTETINKETDRQLPPISYYHYVQYTLVKNEIYIFNFTVPIRQKDKWQPIGHEIMQSIKIDNKANQHEQKVIRKEKKEGTRQSGTSVDPISSPQPEQPQKKTK